jgi:hypothetical protein
MRVSLRVDNGTLRVTATAGVNSLISNGSGAVIVEGTLQSIQDMLGRASRTATD